MDGINILPAGDGTTIGNCPVDEICYSAGCSDKCSKDATDGVAGNGDGSQGNCNAGEFCYADMICSNGVYILITYNLYFKY